MYHSHWAFGYVNLVQGGGSSSLVCCPKAMSEIMAQAEIEARDFVEQKAPQRINVCFFHVLVMGWNGGFTVYICVTL